MSAENHTLLDLIRGGGFAMYPLLACSLAAWAVIFERLWRYSSMKRELESFHLEAMNALLRKDNQALDALCERKAGLPTARLLKVAVSRVRSNDERLRSKWLDAVERSRHLINLDLKRNLWVLGTIGSASPFIGLFGTVVGILRSFQDMAKTGSGGFAVVASGISESLIATAAGIVVAVVAVMAYNAFQVRWNGLVVLIRVQTEELLEVLGADHGA